MSQSPIKLWILRLSSYKTGIVYFFIEQQNTNKVLTLINLINKAIEGRQHAKKEALFRETNSPGIACKLEF